jgi:hypothetical protein
MTIKECSTSIKNLDKMVVQVKDAFLKLGKSSQVLKYHRRSINPVEQEEAAPPARKGTASFQSYMKLKQDAKLPPRISSKLLAHADHDYGKAKKIQGHYD